MSDAALLVPAFQAASYMQRIAHSAKAQSEPFREWICYDDASTDGTAAAAASCGFRVIAGERNRGVSFARNRLAEATTSDWLHFHDADDLMDADYLHHALHAATNDIDVVLCDSSWELEDSRKRIIHWQYRQRECAGGGLEYLVSHPVGVISALIRRSFFQKIGGFDEKMSCWEDADLFVRLAENGARFHCLEKTLVFSLRHNHGLSRNQHHCNCCRLEFLSGYAARFPKEMNHVLAEQAEKLIPLFLMEKDSQNAKRTLQFCRSLGSSPPTTHATMLRLLKPALPALWLIRFQHLLRNSRANRLSKANRT